jgi:hypothetical protein
MAKLEFFDWESYFAWCNPLVKGLVDNGPMLMSWVGTVRRNIMLESVENAYWRKKYQLAYLVFSHGSRIEVMKGRLGVDSWNSSSSNLDIHFCIRSKPGKFILSLLERNGKEPRQTESARAFCIFASSLEASIGKTFNILEAEAIDTEQKTKSCLEDSFCRYHFHNYTDF